MNRTVFLLLIMIHIFSSCVKETDDYANLLLGDWAFLNEKGEYIELYLEDAYLKAYHEKLGDMFGRIEYIIQADSLIFNQMRYRIKLNNDNTIQLSNQDYSLRLYRIYPIKQDSLNEINPFYLRRSNFLVNNGIISMKDAIEYLNKYIPSPYDWKPEEEVLF